MDNGASARAISDGELGTVWTPWLQAGRQGWQAMQDLGPEELELPLAKAEPKELQWSMAAQCLRVKSLAEAEGLSGSPDPKRTFC